LLSQIQLLRHYTKELKTLKEAGVGEQKGVNLVEDVEKTDQKALRLGVNWLSKTALGRSGKSRWGCRTS
jgi:hypothetical protein